MGTPGAVDRILNRQAHIEAALRLRMSLEFPGSDVSLKVKSSTSSDRFGKVDRFQIRWEHPDFIGVVKVKSEFYICPPSYLEDYRACAYHPVSQGAVSRSRIMSAEPVSIWADKIVAVAQRPALNHRDIHDLGYLRNHFDLGDTATRKEALRSTIGIYGRTAEEIDAGLSRDLVLAGQEDFSGFRENMAQWFAEPVMLEMEKDGRLTSLFEGFREEISYGQSLITELAGAKNEQDNMLCTM